MKIYNPQVILFVADVARAARFYAALGFNEEFSATGAGTAPVKMEMALEGFELGLALPGPAAEAHGLTPVTAGHRACLTLWTDDVTAAYTAALDAGAKDLQGPHPFLDGRLRVAFVEDFDGHPIQFVERRTTSDRSGAAADTRDNCTKTGS
ncbi:glyoxalase/bleomycin resistance/extradiol dioxygenase family protein [Arthrobacter sp. zg-Y1110]|uniref:VOC family protein n=1 Tax=Arthrobacter sp. zg-Y1110 TaxID=2886932 RepID=UPI001D14E1A5|nr:VOC family protein [Arthrobacter sp. zg-Y1110]MCC3291559.1 VOC family protein [Arthrobacter sp. zg-Y1110]UWX83967.1 VOC family protein [Arthrobacter sp. zg-Y1110]